jgi:hypothetical protein
MWNGPQDRAEKRIAAGKTAEIDWAWAEAAMRSAHEGGRPLTRHSRNLT